MALMTTKCLHRRAQLTITRTATGRDKCGTWVEDRVQCSGCGYDKPRRYYPDATPTQFNVRASARRMR
jgi:hypothetical protein